MARDKNGHFWGASALLLEGYNDTEVVKEMVSREGLASASDLGMYSFFVASDCANAVRSFEGEEFGRYRAFIWEINARRWSFTRADFVSLKGKDRIMTPI